MSLMKKTTQAINLNIMVKVDFHTHSVLSPDGNISAEQYRQVLESGTLDCIAITDHDTIEFAVELQSELGKDRIIIGEEISTEQGDIIGLFLEKAIAPQPTVDAAVEAIKTQGGIVYIPHPFETIRSGVKEDDLKRIEKQVDIIESANGRAYFQNYGPQAHTWARMHNIPAFASSDAHRSGTLGKTYSSLQDTPTAENIRELVKTARKTYARPSLLDILAPKLNRLRKLF